MDADKENAARARERGERLIPTVEFNGLLRGQAEWAAGEFRKESRAPQFPPRLSLIQDRPPGVDGRKIAILALTGLPEGEEKRKRLFIIGTEAAMNGLTAVAAFLVAESWIKRMTPAEGWRSKGKPIPLPSRCPDRTEAIVIFGSTLDGRLNMAMADIQRGRARPATLGPWEFNDRNGESDLLKYFFAGHFLGCKAREEKKGNA